MVNEDFLEIELQDLENRIMELKIAGYRVNEQMLAQYEILKALRQETENEDK